MSKAIIDVILSFLKSWLSESWALIEPNNWLCSNAVIVISVFVIIPLQWTGVYGLLRKGPVYFSIRGYILYFKYCSSLSFNCELLQGVNNSVALHGKDIVVHMRKKVLYRYCLTNMTDLNKRMSLLCNMQRKYQRHILCHSRSLSSLDFLSLDLLSQPLDYFLMKSLLSQCLSS